MSLQVTEANRQTCSELEKEASTPDKLSYVRAPMILVRLRQKHLGLYRT